MKHRLTPAIQQAIVAYIRAGGFPHVAAESAGVPCRVFERWLRKGEERRTSKRYRSFAAAVRQAAAHARLGAEVQVRTDKPLDWLRYGPGRESSDRPGWTSAARPQPISRSESPLLDPAFAALLARLLEALADFPEARAAAARLIDSAASPGFRPGMSG
jgi:hypothetical protein